MKAPKNRETPQRDLRSLVPGFTEAKPMNLKEAEQSRAGLVLALLEIWKLMDQTITNTNADHAEAYIWQVIDEEDTTYIASQMTQAAVVSPVAAFAVRGIIEAHQKYKLGLIVGPRMIDTFGFYAEHGLGLPRRKGKK